MARFDFPRETTPILLRASFRFPLPMGYLVLPVADGQDGPPYRVCPVPVRGRAPMAHLRPESILIRPAAV